MADGRWPSGDQVECQLSVLLLRQKAGPHERKLERARAVTQPRIDGRKPPQAAANAENNADPAKIRGEGLAQINHN
jgi:hypothetical protein